MPYETVVLPPSGSGNLLQLLNVVSGQLMLLGAFDDALQVEPVRLQPLADFAGEVGLGSDLVALVVHDIDLDAAVVLGDAFEAVERAQLLLGHAVEHAPNHLALGDDDVAGASSAAGHLVKV